MNLVTILAVAFALGIDAFSLSIGIGLSGIQRKQMYLVSTVVAIFHILMPLIGLYLGQVLGKFVGPIASSFGAIVLIFIGIHTIWGKLKESKGSSNISTFDAISINHPVSLILMAISVSLDALTVGLGLGALRFDLTLTVLIMGIVAGIMTFGGLIFGKRLSRSVGEKAELLSGVILIAIGIKLLVS
ncbi:MAG: manganese efflux pump MntP family protein [Peptococcales bacterium]|jgi:putative Mn2+ efflux pump MntP